MRILVTITLLVVTITTGLADIKKYDASQFITKRKNEVASAFDNQKYNFDLYDSKASKIFKSDDRQLIIENFPVNSNYSVDLNLVKKRSAFAENIKIVISSDDGDVIYNRPNSSTYYGKVVGQPNSDVFFTYSSIGLVGYIQDENGETYDISSNLSKLGNDRVEHSISETTWSENVGGAIATCGFDDYVEFDNEINKEINQTNSTLAKDNLIEVKIAVDGNFEYFLMFCQYLTNKSKNQWDTGEAWFNKMTAEQKQQAATNAIDYIENVMSSVDRIYNRETSMLITVNYLKLFTSFNSDPYKSVFGGTLSSKLGRMSNIWASRDNEAPDRNLVTVFTDIDRQTVSGTAGIAYPGPGYNSSLCSKYLGYSALGIRGQVSFPVLRYSSDVVTAAHEFGHNFGSPHTHYCGWPQLTGENLIDSCVSVGLASDSDCISESERRIKNDGTIMSYCHIGGSVVLDFHPRIKNRIRDKVENKFGSCTNFPTSPVIRLISPLGNEKLFVGETHKIKFQSANVTNARILYSVDNGNNWDEIAVVNASNIDTYDWVIPDNMNDNVIFRVESVLNPNVFDQSILPNSITEMALIGTFPEPNMKIGYLESHLLLWNRKNVENVNVKYSLDNGNTYTYIVQNEQVNSKFFDFPDVNTQQGVLVIESTNNPSINEVIPFQLGKEVVNFTAPRINDTLDLEDEKYLISFSTEFINDEFNIKFQLNDEQPKLITNFAKKVDLETNTYEWFFSDEIKAGDRGKLTAVLKTSSIEVGQTLGEFYFEKSVTNVGKQFSINLSIKSIVPNPADENFTLEINNLYPSLQHAKVSIITQDGKLVTEIPDQILVQGITTINVDVANLNSGTYYVIIETEKNKDIQQLKVVR